ncbi:MAG: AAA family ATPase [Deltaproteobacteria bacterium]|jgi:SpoVK/Ycf46/Vps4 family AAA+-type ATPase|nr:AAA family ATPase [Deltaproteobacteria bacterium]
MRKRYTNNREIKVATKETPILTSGNTWINHMGSIITLRTIETTGIYDTCSIAAINNMVGYQAIISKIEDLEGLRGVDDIDYEGCDSDEDLALEMMKMLERQGMRTQKYICRSLLTTLEGHIEDTREDANSSEMELKFKNLVEILDLGRLEQRVIRLLLCIQHFDTLSYYLKNHLDIFKVINRPILTNILNTTSSEISKCIKGKLSVMELICGDINDDLELQDVFYSLMDAPSSLDALDNFAPLKKPILSVEDFFVDKESFSMMKKLLAYDSETPTHILLYGPAGVGKTEFCRTLTAASGLKAFEVIPEIKISEHRSNLILADAFVRKEKNAVLVIDEADKLLTGSNNASALDEILELYSRTDGNSIGWLDAFMEKAGSKCIWIINNHMGLRDTVIRRFAYSVSFPNLGKKERIKIWQTTKGKLESLGSSLLTEEELKKLASTYQVSPGIIGQSFRKSLEADPEDAETLNSYINRQIMAHEKLSRQVSKSIHLEDNYSLESVCSVPSAREIVDILKRYKAGTKDLPYTRRHGIKFLFHGLPGTGKTEFANYLANTLDMEIVHGRYSEVLSPYMGMAEINLNDLFNRAQVSNGILCIDEVESFLTVRDYSVLHHYQIIINEFLTCLERFNGIFIGTTNRGEVMDLAAIRRFTFKVKFSSLDGSARVELFNKMLLPISKNSLTEPERQELLSINSITPGDFSNVASIYKWKSSVRHSNLELLEALKIEASFRENGSSIKKASEAFGESEKIKIKRVN